MWDLPGGHIEAGETELAALRREMHEDVGVQIANGSAIHLRRLAAGRGRELVRLSAWLVGEWQGTPTNIAPIEHDEICWFRPEELPPLAHELLGTAVQTRWAERHLSPSCRQRSFTNCRKWVIWTCYQFAFRPDDGRQFFANQVNRVV